MPMMNEGETVRFECGQCLKEFEVTLEPKRKGEKVNPEESEDCTFCPFCGEDGIRDVEYT